MPMVTGPYPEAVKQTDAMRMKRTVRQQPAHPVTKNAKRMVLKPAIPMGNGANPTKHANMAALTTKPAKSVKTPQNYARATITKSAFQENGLVKPMHLTARTAPAVLPTVTVARNVQMATQNAMKTA